MGNGAGALFRLPVPDVMVRGSRRPRPNTYGTVRDSGRSAGLWTAAGAVC